MSGRGERTASFGGMGRPVALGGGEGRRAVGEGPSAPESSFRRQEYRHPAASRERMREVEHEDENVSGSGAGRSQAGPFGGGGRGRGRGRRDSMDSTEALGRCMTAILRHRASDYGLEMKSDGFVLVADLLKLSKKTAAGTPLSSHSVEDVREAVARDGKKRFGLKEEDGQLYIRANQGHSIRTVESGELLSLITSPSQIPVCVHGTYERFMDSIWQEGLKRMNRNHVHFATGLPKQDGVISGMRGSAQILIYLNVEKAMEDGMKLYVSDNNVVLTDGFDGVVPTKYFKNVVKKLPRGREMPLHPPSFQSEPRPNATADFPNLKH